MPFCIPLFLVVLLSVSAVALHLTLLRATCTVILQLKASALDALVAGTGLAVPDLNTGLQLLDTVGAIFGDADDGTSSVLLGNTATDAVGVS